MKNLCAKLNLDLHPDKCLIDWQRVVNEGLKEAYSNDDLTVRNEIRELIALPFIHPDDVEEVFDELYEDVSAEVEPIASYIERIYVRGTSRRGRH